MPFLVPAIFGLFILGTGLCIAAYRFNSSKKRIVIPSSFLLKDFPIKKRADSKNFPPRLIFELLFIALTCLALFLLNRQNAIQKELVIFDNSQSMSAIDGDSKTSRISQAANNFLNSASTVSQYKVISLPEAGLDQRQEAGKSQKKEYEILSLVSPIIKELKGSTLPDLSSSTLPAILSESDADKIIIYTDKNLTFGAELKDIASKIEVRKIGSPVSNVFIEDISIAQQDGASDTINARVSFSGKGSTNGSIVLLEKEGLSNKVIATKNFVVSSGQSTDISFSTPTSNKVYQIKIEKTLQGDAILSDNIAYLAQAKSVEGTIYLVTDNLEFQNLTKGLTEASGKQVVLLGLSEIAKIGKEKLEGSIFIFYKSPLPKEFLANSLVILPADESNILSLKAVQKNINITSWDQASPITKYISFGTLKIPQSMVFNPANWANGVVSNEGGSVLLSGILMNKKVIVSGFELLPFDRLRKSASDVLLLNAIGELSQAGEVLNRNLLLRSKYKDLKCISGDEYCFDSSPYLQRGIYKEKSENVETLFAVNNFSRNESDTFFSNSEAIALSKAPMSNSQFESLTQTRIFSSIALGLLLFEMLLVIARKSELNWRVRK